MPRAGEPVVRLCHHGGKHLHGTRERYIRDKCRCTACRAANAASAKARRRAIAYGRNWRGLVDPAAAREHLAVLRAGGVGVQRLSRASGLSHTALGDVIYGRAKRIRKSTEAAVLALPLDPAAYRHRQCVSQVGTTRRIRALMRIGYSARKQSEILGFHERTVWVISVGNRPVTEETALAVKAMYDRLWATPRIGTTPTERMSVAMAISNAKRNGYPPPMAWDEDTIDDPDARPVEGIERAARKRVQRHAADVIEDLDWLYRAGTDPAGAARRIGMTPTSLQTVARRNGRKDLAAWIARGEAA